MTDDTRLDAQMRSALAELPMPDDIETRAALGDVLRRSRAEPTPSRWRAPVMVAAAVVAIVLLAGVLIGLGSGDQSPPVADPGSQLRGDWQRDVHSHQQGWNGTWSMRFDHDGVFELVGPATTSASTEGASYALEAHSLRVDVFVNNVCSELPAGRYLWSRTGDVLTLTVLEDRCPVRAALLRGSWRTP